MELHNKKEWECMNTYFGVNELYEEIRVYGEKHHLVQTLQALPFMKECHSGQFRKKTWFSDEKVPYIVHPLTIAVHAISLGICKDEMLAAILLHDVCEDCPVENSDLPVNEEAKELVSMLTFVKPDGTEKDVAKRIYFQRLLENKEAAMLKLLDRCHNVSTMAASFSKEKLIEYINETQEYVYPLLEKLITSAPEYQEALFSIKYHMMSNVETIKNLLLRDL